LDPAGAAVAPVGFTPGFVIFSWSAIDCLCWSTIVELLPGALFIAPDFAPPAASAQLFTPFAIAASSSG